MLDPIAGDRLGLVSRTRLWSRQASLSAIRVEGVTDFPRYGPSILRFDLVVLSVKRSHSSTIAALLSFLRSISQYSGGFRIGLPGSCAFPGRVEQRFDCLPRLELLDLLAHPILEASVECTPLGGPEGRSAPSRSLKQCPALVG